MGVATFSGIPAVLGAIAGGGSVPIVVRYTVPAGVTMFKSSIYATAADACGAVHDYPGPAPGA